MDKGIIFSGAMVRALLDGRKTQTRRVIKGVPDWAVHASCIFKPTSLWQWSEAEQNPPRLLNRWPNRDEGKTLPYAPGDRLYVREAHTFRGVYSDVVEVGYKASELDGYTQFVEQWPVGTAKDAKGRPPKVTWPAYKPSIHMPRWASRLTLLVTDVRVDRVAGISEADAIAEGIEPRGMGSLWGWADYEETNPNVYRQFADPRVSFQSLWNSLHNKPGERWSDNPWVVAVSFDVRPGNIDSIAKEAA